MGEVSTGSTGESGSGGVGRRRTRSFGPTVLLGLAGAVLAAVAGSRTWAQSSGDAAGIRVTASATGSDSTPLAAALALVALAAWGVVLVTRGRVRRLVSVAGLAASTGALVAVGSGFGDAQETARAAALARGATGDVLVSGLSAWYYLTGVGAALTAAAFVLATARAPQWPAMGAKYDAPAARRERPAADEDLWRALDEGRDPTS